MANTKKSSTRNNKGLVKLREINRKAKTIREAAGSTTSTVKVKKYKMKQTTAIKQAAQLLRAEDRRAKFLSPKKKTRKTSKK